MLRDPLRRGSLRGKPDLFERILTGNIQQPRSFEGFEQRIKFTDVQSAGFQDFGRCGNSRRLGMHGPMVGLPHYYAKQVSRLDRDRPQTVKKRFVS